MSSNGGFQPSAETVVLSHTSALVADVLARALTLAGVPCRVGSSAAAREVLVGNRSDAHLELGAPGAVGPAHDVAHLVAAVRDVQAGRRPTPPRPPDARSSALPALTDREREVLLLITAGASNETMAQTLAISPHTVRTHVQNLLAKLGVQNRLAAAAVARRSGLLAESA